MDISNRQKVVNILNDYYGEDRVDDQGNNILIYWPEVTITNENNRSIDIKELYAKIKVKKNGTLEGTFRLNRAEYSCVEWYNNYMHSHVNYISKNNPSAFSSSCLGWGPIRDTMVFLNSTFDEDFWIMFALELDKYVHNESLQGGPYHRMENLNRLPETKINEFLVIIKNSPGTEFIGADTLDGILREFVPYIISKRFFKFSFAEGKYCIADSPFNIIVKLSNLFIEWFNNIPEDSKKLEIRNYMSNNGYIAKYKIREHNLFRLEPSVHDYTPYREANGRELWTFKGQTLHLNITGIPKKNDEIPMIEDPFLSTILNPSLALYIANRILNVINYQHGRTETQYTGTDKKTCYISTYNTSRCRT